jgi:YHS domain-containing protein
MIKLVNTTPRFSADYSGFTLYFSTMSNRETFTAHPERFVPQYAGYCAWGVAKGYKAAIDPESFTITALELQSISACQLAKGHTWISPAG